MAIPYDPRTLDIMTIGAAAEISGEVRSDADLTIEGQINGQIWCEEGELVVAANGRMTGDIVARDVTICGRVEGQVIATDVVDIRAGAQVNARVIARRLILHDGAAFNGRVEPQHIDTAIQVLRFQRQRTAG